MSAGQTVKLDPSEAGWKVEQGEQIIVSAMNYLDKAVETNLLIK
jgi:hypothetical protein